MTGPKTTRNGDTYHIPASLIHRLIVSIITSIVVIGAYMVTWAFTDQAVKSAQDERIHALEARLEAWENRGVLDVADRRLDFLERWRVRVEEHLKRHDQELDRQD